MLPVLLLFQKFIEFFYVLEYTGSLYTGKLKIFLSVTGSPILNRRFLMRANI